jgi:hypothetical protein
MSNSADALTMAMKHIRQCLASDHENQDDPWLDELHDMLGNLAAAIQYEVQSAEQAQRAIGEINPDFADAPTTEHHIETMREQFIRAGEIVHQLRADIRNISGPASDRSSLSTRTEELLHELEKVRETDNRFLLETLNSNPGAGE